MPPDLSWPKHGLASPKKMREVQEYFVEINREFVTKCRNLVYANQGVITITRDAARRKVEDTPLQSIEEKESSPGAKSQLSGVIEEMDMESGASPSPKRGDTRGSLFVSMPN